MNATRHRFTVIFRNTNTGEERSLCLLAEDDADAVRSAVCRLWGKSAGWFRDNGLANIGNFGQVTKPIKGQPGAYTCLTGRMRATVLSGYVR